MFRAVALATLLVLGSATGATAAEEVTTGGNWTGSWQTAMSGTAPDTEHGLPDHSIRNLVHTSAGGSEVRVRLSNVFGKAAVRMGHVTVALAVAPDSPDAVPGTMRALTFGGAPSVTIPAGAEALSDPLRFRVPERGDLLVTVFTPEPSGPVTYHQVANQTSFLGTGGDHAADESGAAFTGRTTSWHYVSGVDVRGGPAPGSVVLLGDSITDGNASTLNANSRWPDLLAARLPGLGVLNAGISSNRLLSDTWNPNALSRLDRDVLTATGARSVVVLLGINDIGGQPQHHEPSGIIAALKQIAEQTRAKGLRVLGGTLTPFGGSSNYTEELEGVRLAVNEFIRTGGAFDSVVDFDAALRDPAVPQRLRPEYDSGDHLHPSDAGYRAMAGAVRLWELLLPGRGDRWTGSWQTTMANTATEHGMPDRSIRNLVHTSVGGTEARVRLSNALGRVPVLMGRVTVAVAARPDAPDAVPGTMRELRFGGSPSITIPPGAEVLSDPVRLGVPEDGDLLVSTYTPEPSGPVSTHPRAYQTSFISTGGDHTAAESGAAFGTPTTAWHYVTGVEVRAVAAGGTVVAFGDSITDGDKSTPNTNRRWPDVLADRLKDRPGPTRLGVLNAGISGNRVLDDSAPGGIGGPNALARLDRDVTTATGARTVVVLAGINDIGNLDLPDATRLTAALGQIAAQARGNGLRVVGATITPFKGWRSYTGQRESVRLAANEFIRTSGVFDGVLDFDEVVRDPADPQRIRPDYDSGDHLHPSDAGYRAMGESIDLRLLT